MNRKYKKHWLIDKAAAAENRLRRQKDWCIPDRELAMRAGLIKGHETKEQMRGILNVAYAADKKSRRIERDTRTTGDAFLLSREWRALRYKALKIHGARCQCCGASAQDGTQIHVDHIKPRSKYPHLALELSNLQILCVDCNLGKSNKDETDWRPLEAANDTNMRHLRAILEGQ